MIPTIFMTKINSDLKMKPESDPFLALKDICTVLKVSIKRRFSSLFAANENIRPRHYSRHYPAITLRYGQVYRMYKEQEKTEAVTAFTK